MTISFWASLDAVRGSAGEDVSAAVFYPGDDRYFLPREQTVSHYEVYDAGEGG